MPKVSKKYPSKTPEEIRRQVADRVIKLMKEHGTNWVKPWASAMHSEPTSMSTGKRYNGINWIILAMERAEKGYKSGEWATYQQWKKRGAHVRANERGTMVILYKPTVWEKKNQATGEIERIPSRLLKSFNVWNADQVENYQATVYNAPDYAPDAQIVSQVDAWAAQTAITRRQIDDVPAYYSPNEDFINIPPSAAFTSAEGYAGTVAHELVHATGHEKRLNRLVKTHFGTKDYAFEELVAELGAAMCCVELGVTPDPRPDHAKYLNSWMKRLQDDPKTILKAAEKAQEAVSFLAEQVQQTTARLAA